jgi:peptide-methionine (S)-S-oxide reductase
MEKITLGGGCFWCTEAVFQRLEGVSQVISGYMGGHVDNPTYKDICTGQSGHAEVIEISFDSETISLEQILEVFWATHDPTTLNRQGADKGTQYRSVVFYNSLEQKEVTQNSIDEVAAKVWDDPIVTQVVPIAKFYTAEQYHQDYYNQNSYRGYCQVVISPKINKLKSSYATLLKS